MQSARHAFVDRQAWLRAGCGVALRIVTVLDEDAGRSAGVHAKQNLTSCDGVAIRRSVTNNRAWTALNDELAKTNGYVALGREMFAVFEYVPHDGAALPFSARSLKVDRTDPVVRKNISRVAGEV